jgi:hypothetical protein
VGCNKWDNKLKQWTDRPGGRIDGWESPGFRNLHDGDPYAIALSLNVHRRHLNAEDKRKLIADVLKAKPELSDRAIGRLTKADHKTVGDIQSKANGEIPHKAIDHVETEANGEIPHKPDRVEASGRQARGRKPATGNKPAAEAAKPIKTVIGAEPEAKPNRITANASQRALGEFKVACNYWFPKISRDDRLEAIVYFHKVAGVGATNGGGAA